MPSLNSATDVSLTPRMSIGVGVTGHRLARLNAGALPAITATAARVIEAIAQAATVPDAASLRLITALADGADGLVADAAIARGWTVDAVLPFARDDYAADFAEGSVRDAYARHVAAARSVFELPGSRDAAAGHAVAYERAGRVVLSQCDILITVWDGDPVRGRGGAAQIVAEAVLQGIPVIHIDANGSAAPMLLWDGLEDHDVGQQTIETVPRGDLSRLPALLGDLIALPQAPAEAQMLRQFENDRPRKRGALALAYPLLLSIMGVRRLRMRGVQAARAMPETLLDRRFAHADGTASAFAQIFRSGYVTNFSFAALAVVLSLLGLALPATLKPVLILAEFAAIAVILILTQRGNRAGWHRRWLDSRHLAERLRCLAIGAQLGDLDLRADADRRPGWVSWYVRATAREIGLPHARVDIAYLDGVRRGLTSLIDDQVAYLTGEAHQMHRLEHRLHLLGTLLFAMTAVICVLVLLVKVADTMAVSAAVTHIAHPLIVAATIGSAALPAIGAAIYGIRMQGDFAGTAERSEDLAHHLSMLRAVIADDDTGFDTLNRRVRRATDLLTEDLANWLQTYHARPLALPG